MQAITTKHIPATDTKGRRIKASAPAGSVIVPWDYELDEQGNHANAAIALMKRLHWAGKLAIGGTQSGYVFVFVNSTTDYIDVKGF